MDSWQHYIVIVNVVHRTGDGRPIVTHWDTLLDSWYQTEAQAKSCFLGVLRGE